MRIDGGQVDYRLCVGGRVAKGRGALRVIGPGRFVLPGLKSPVWVLWVDGDYRSLVLGTPKGGFGIVLDRGSMSGDREAAAREIFDWNGYDLRRYTRF
jgi:apolipoprotein D and lipocalin family protein